MADSLEFEFPFKAYKGQVALAREIFTCLDESKIGIMESPTGTGKSMAIIIGAFSWLLQNKVNGKKLLKESQKKSEKNVNVALPEWLRSSAMETEAKQLGEAAIQREKDIEEMLSQPPPPQKTSSLFERFKNKERPLNLSENPLSTSSKRKKEEEDVNDLLIDTEKDEEEVREGLEITKKIKRALDASLHPIRIQSEESLVEQYRGFEPLRVIFCSRTHTQLAQFIQELKRTQFVNKLRVVMLGSRNNLCVQEKLASLPSGHVNENCLKLREKNKCQFYEGEKDDQIFKEILRNVRTMEESKEKSKKSGKGCPYYSHRRASQYADVICAPYQCILQEEIRESVGLSLKNSIVIFDEAHNVVDAVSSMGKAQVTSTELQQLEECLSHYLERFQKSLKAKSSMHLACLANVVRGLLRFTNADSSNSKAKGEYSVIPLAEIYSATRLDTVDIGELSSFIKKAKLSFKLNFFLQKRTGNDLAASRLDSLVEFLLKLTSCDNAVSNRLVRVHSKETRESCLVFLEMKSKEIQRIVDQAKSVLFVGGTLQPFGLITSIIGQKNSKRIKTASFAHVIPKENFMAFCVSGLTKTKFRFTYDNQEDPVMLSGLLSLINYTAPIVSGGKLAFFPSYKMLNGFSVVLKGNPGMLSGTKVIFDQKNKSDQAFSDYVKAVSERKQVILMTVMAGKLSEGINFGDELARVVYLVGLPYPNKNSPEISERMRFLDFQKGSKRENSEETKGTKEVAANLSKTGGMPGGNEYYENLCMKTVNQTIGRSVRHAEDFAAVCLCDERYDQEKIKEKLPRWVIDSLTKTQRNEEEVGKTLKQFFLNKKSKY